MKNYLVVILVLFVVILTGTTFYFWFKFNTLSVCKYAENDIKNESTEIKDEVVNENKVESDLPEGSFKKITNEFGDELLEGDLYLKGYFEKIENLEDHSGEKYEVVIFCVSNYGKKTDLTDMMGFDENKCLSLGCLNNNTINTERLIEGKKVFNDILPKNDTDYILNSSVENPIIIHVGVQNLPNFGVPKCYSAFNRSLEVYKK